MGLVVADAERDGDADGDRSPGRHPGGERAAATIAASSIAWSVRPFIDRALHAVILGRPSYRPEDPQSW